MQFSILFGRTLPIIDCEYTETALDCINRKTPPDLPNSKSELFYFLKILFLYTLHDNLKTTSSYWKGNFYHANKYTYAYTRAASLVAAAKG